MSHLPKVLHAFGRILSYPDERTMEAAELLYVLLRDEIPEAAAEMSALGAWLAETADSAARRRDPGAAGGDLRDAEESFTRTFDINPACALEVGWHLFGEEYARGMFLVRMRQELRKFGLAESAELPDHIHHVLAVLAAMPDAEAARFASACVQPAVEKMNRALASRETPYRHAMNCLALVLRHVWGAPAELDSAQNTGARPFASDPLHSFRVADVSCAGGCSAAGDEPAALVQLDMQFPTTQRPARADQPTAKVNRP